MKEENKKPTAKKVTTKKSTTVTKKPSVKKTATKVAVAKKTTKKTPTKVAVAKKTTKTVASKVNVTKGATPKKVVKKIDDVDVKVENKVVNEVVVEKESENINKNLVIRALLLMSYTLIIVFLVIGFVDSLTKNTAEGPKKAISSYVKNGNVLEKSNLIDLEDASFKLSAINGDYFIYISYTDKNVNVFERDLIKLFNNKKIKGKLYYINVDEIKNEENVISLINKYLSFKDALVNKVPTIVYVNRDNIIRTENIISGSGNNLLSISEVENLLDRNGY